MKTAPDYLKDLTEYIESVIPEGTPYVFVAEPPNEAGELETHIIHTADNDAELAKSLRAVARSLEGDC